MSVLPVYLFADGKKAFLVLAKEKNGGTYKDFSGDKDRNEKIFKCASEEFY